ncbi:hypothetical protein [Dictyobacter formicarum]|uniref:Uncharacterized protein n=1 Tax=Dictyobacter formicarum TaxID=2778368 RepID=A0ABQ3VWH1_9CHLR|nr:hypothetical protein [Dictyobacter formicarum]GHO89918.1 hypothetical protein KSZ_79240 [Dictyobacter formicarum]
MNKLQRLFFMAGVVPNKQNYIVLGVAIASFMLTILFGALAITYNTLLWRLLAVFTIIPGMTLVLGGSYRLIDWSLSDKQDRARIEKEEASKLVRGWVEVNEHEQKKQEINQKSEPSL